MFHSLNFICKMLFIKITFLFFATASSECLFLNGSGSVEGASKLKAEFLWPYVNNTPFPRVALNGEINVDASINVSADTSTEIETTELSLILKEDDIMTFRYNSSAVLIQAFPSTHTSYITGGVLGTNNYILSYVEILWDTVFDLPSYIDGKPIPSFEINFIFYQEKYGSINRAMRHRDGLVFLSVKIDVVDGPDNLLFEELGQSMKLCRENKISVSISVRNLFSTFVPLLNSKQYYSFPGTYADIPCAIIVVLPQEQNPRISKQQYCKFVKSQQRTFLAAYPVKKYGPVVKTGPLHTNYN